MRFQVQRWIPPQGGPLNKVLIRLLPIWDQFATLATWTDEQGHFSLSGIRANPTYTLYRLRANRTVYLEASYGANIRLNPCKLPGPITVKLVADAVITGIIRDSDGEPVEGAVVHLGRPTFEYGERRVESFKQTLTDDRGEYRFSSLAAGRYYVAGELRGAGGASFGLATLYHGVRDVASATPVVVSPGVVQAGVDISLLRGRVFRVRGRVANMVADDGRLSVELRDRANEGMRTREPEANIDGDSFEFSAVPQGSYELAVYQNSQAAKQVIQVSSDIDDLSVPLQPDTEIEFKYAVDGRREQPNLTDTIQQSLTPVGENRFLRLPNCVYGIKPQSVPPDRYTLRFFGDILRTMYVKSATAAGFGDVLKEGLNVQGPGRITVNVVLGDDGAKLTGVVRGREGKPAPGATVLFLPVERKKEEAQEGGDVNSSMLAGLECFQRLGAAIGRCIEAGAIPPGNVNLMAQIAWTSAHGLTSCLVVMKNDPHFPWEPVDRLIDAMADNILTGLENGATERRRAPQGRVPLPELF